MLDDSMQLRTDAHDAIGVRAPLRMVGKRSEKFSIDFRVRHGTGISRGAAEALAELPLK